MKIELANLKTSSSETTVKEYLIEAVQELNYKTYVKCKNMQMCAYRDLEKRVIPDPNLRRKEVHIYLRAYPDKPPRICVFPNLGWCGCENRVPDDNPCEHEIKLYEGYRKDLHIECHMSLECVTGSLRE